MVELSRLQLVRANEDSLECVLFCKDALDQIIGLLQMIRAISPTDQYPLIYIPLLFVLTLNALRDAIEENKRKKKDKEINQRPAHMVLKGDHNAQVQQFELRVGNVIRVSQNETFPADLVLLASSDHGK